MAPRVDWVDYAKGICIVMVVMMHSTLGVGLAAGHEGFMHLVVAFAKPFRMPDFFLISGLFLARVIDRDWRTYADRKVVHFAYFYLLWLTIQFAVKAPSFAAEAGWAHVGEQYLLAFIEPFGTLWFIYLLPIFFVVTKLTRGAPPWLILVAAAALETLHVTTGWTVIDEFAARFVYFYAGYLFANAVFALSDRVRGNPRAALAGLALWAVVNGAIVHAGASQWPLVSLVLGFAGAIAVVATGTLLARAHRLDWLRYCGEHSLVIYLAFFLPMAAARTALLKVGVPADIGMVSLLVTIAGVTGALMIWWAARAARLDFLFTRPARFWIAPAKPRQVLQAAH
ncbi:MAG: acyltransferase family protein [Xanthobacteraceae bacterium]|nr:acyltransferase family protein [Xanthobacteraceae bacterium]